MVNDAKVINESRKSQETLVNEIKILKETIKRTTNMLKQKQKIEPLDKEIKNLKLKWKKGDQGDKLYNEHIYYSINALKKQRSDVSYELGKLKHELKKHRQLEYIKRGVVKFGDHIKQKQKKSDSTKVLQQQVTVNKQGHGLIHASNANIDPTTIDDNDFTFSGTENGLVSMTSTVSFSLHRFRFHLELSNRYHALADSSDISVDILEKYKDQNYLNLPKSRIIKSKEIQVSSGAWKRSKMLERKKKATEEGKEISRIEKEMSDSSLKHVTNILDLQTIYVSSEARFEIFTTPVIKQEKLELQRYRSKVVN
jgi:hypothetical protein